MSRTIFVSGATGNIGMQLVPRLTAAGATVHAFVRDLEKAKPLAEAGAKLFQGDFEDAAAVEAAMAGCDTVFSITPPNPRAVEQVHVQIEAAKKMETPPNFIRLSVIKSGADAPTDNGVLHGKTDEEILNSGLNYTILRPHFFMQNIWGAVGTIADHGSMYMGMGEGKLAMIDVRDIVDSAFEVTMNRPVENKIWTLTGPASIDFNQVAASIGNTIGKEVKYVPVGLDDVKKAMLDMGWNEWGANVMAQYSDAYSKGWGEFTTNDVQELTGNPARSIDQFTSEVLTYAFQGAEA